jgi:hypothetical protein
MHLAADWLLVSAFVVIGAFCCFVFLPSTIVRSFVYVRDKVCFRLVE